MSGSLGGAEGLRAEGGLGAGGIVVVKSAKWGELALLDIVVEENDYSVKGRSRGQKRSVTE